MRSTPRRSALPVLPALLALAAPAAPGPAGGAQAGGDAFALELPDGPLARAWAGVGPETKALDPAPRFAAERAWLLDGADDDGARWAAWAAWLADAQGPAPEPRARAGLALLARAEGRWEDLWAHLAALGGHPEWLAGLMPLCLPGAPADVAPGAGGAAGPLPDGALLAPAPPPRPAGPEAWRAATYRAQLGPLAIGAAEVELTLSVEPSGVQLDARHVAGGPARFSVRMPAPEDLELRVEYVDWMRQEALGAPLPVALEPGATVTLFARGRARRAELPASPQGPLPAGLRLGGLWLAPAPGRAASPAARAAAAAFGAALGIPAGVRPADAPVALAGVTVSLPGDPAAEARLLARLASRVERRLLGGL